MLSWAAPTTRGTCSTTTTRLVETHIYGVMFLDGAWTIEISFENDGQPRPLTQEERDEVTSSLLATFKPHRENL